MKRVTVEQQEGVLRIRVNYKWERVSKILVGVFLLVPAAITVPVCAFLASLFPDDAAGIQLAIVILLACTIGGLSYMLLRANHQQMMSVTASDGILEDVHAFGFLSFHRRYPLTDVVDIVQDAKRAETPGDKHFLWFFLANGQRARITRPSIRLTAGDVDQVYDALRPYIPSPPPAQRLRYFHHITVAEDGTQTVITFRTHLHFIAVRYKGILYSLVGFMAAAVVPEIILGVPEMILYPGTAVIGLFLLLYLPFLLPWRKRHLANNHNRATLYINNDRPTIAAHNIVGRSEHDYPSIRLADITNVSTYTDSELTFARRGTTEYTTYYTINLEGRGNSIFLYTTENHAQALLVKDFLDNLIKEAKK